MRTQIQIREEIDQLEKTFSASVCSLVDVQRYYEFYNQIDRKTNDDQRKLIHYLHQIVHLSIEQKEWTATEHSLQLLIERLNAIPEKFRTDEDKRNRAILLNKLADSQAHQKKWTDAEKNFQSAIDELETISNESCTNEDERILARCLYKLGTILSRREEWTIAERCYQRAVAISDVIPEKFRTDQDKKNRETYSKSLREALGKRKQGEQYLKPLETHYLQSLEQK